MQSFDLISLIRMQSSITNCAAECKLSQLHTQETKVSIEIHAVHQMTLKTIQMIGLCTATLCWLDRNNLIQVNRLPQIPMWFSFRDNLLYGTMLNTLEKSIKITCIDEYLSRDLAQ